MDQNQTIDSDLQRAIDDITKTTSVDPVFSDPVAAPSSVPEGDTGELGVPIGPFPAPEPVIPEPMVMPESVMPTEPVVPVIPPAPEPMAMPMPPMPEMVNNGGLSIEQVKEAALRDLAPLLSNMHINPSQKFRIYRDIYETMHDYKVLEPAYATAKEIVDENERGEALLYLVESIDRM